MVFLDMVAHALELDLAEVRALAEPAEWWLGVGQAREALAWADARSASPWESRLRMFYQREAGLPRPAVNVPIFDLDERFLGIADLFDEEAGRSGHAREFVGACPAQAAPRGVLLSRDRTPLSLPRRPGEAST